jgi:hypothetical protein
VEKQAEDEQFFTKSFEEKNVEKGIGKLKLLLIQELKKSAEIQTTGDDVSPRGSRFLPPPLYPRRTKAPPKGRREL